VKVFYLSPLHFVSPQLFETFSFEKSDIENADVCFFDMHNGFDGYDFSVIHEVVERRLPVVYFDFSDHIGAEDLRVNWFGFDNWRGLESNSQDWAVALKLFISNNLLRIYFMRKMSVRESYQPFVYPIELTLYPNHDFAPAAKWELTSRPYDMTFIGNSSPCRANMVCDLVPDFKINYLFTLVRLENAAWINEHYKGKFFIEADGGGFGSERFLQLMFIAPMVRQRNDQKYAYPFTDMVNCVEVGNGWGRISKNDVEKLQSVLQDKDKMYDIYMGGMEHIKKYYSDEARNNYIENILKLNGLCPQLAL